MLLKLVCTNHTQRQKPHSATDEDLNWKYMFLSRRKDFFTIFPVCRRDSCSDGYGLFYNMYVRHTIRQVWSVTLRCRSDAKQFKAAGIWKYVRQCGWMMMMVCVLCMRAHRPVNAWALITELWYCSSTITLCNYDHCVEEQKKNNAENTPLVEDSEYSLHCSVINAFWYTTKTVDW